MSNNTLHLLLSSILLISPLPQLTAQMRTGSLKEDPKNLKAGIPVYIPPQGWQAPDPNKIKLPPRVHSMIVGKGPSTVPPSINLSSQPYNGTLKQYLQLVKDKNLEKGDVWKDLGAIKTAAGTASLSQVDSKSPHGEMRNMHTILVKNGTVYIMTAGALKSEFSMFYQDFFNAMRSLRIASDVYDTVPNPQQRTELKSAIEKIKKQWSDTISQRHRESPAIDIQAIKEQVFESDSFKKSEWIPFKEMLSKKYSELGNGWIEAVQIQMEDDLFDDSSTTPAANEQKIK